MAALSVDKANLSRMISISSRIPPDVIETIGAAPGYGRQRWQELTDLLEDKVTILMSSERLSAEPSLRLLVAIRGSTLYLSH